MSTATSEKPTRIASSAPEAGKAVKGGKAGKSGKGGAAEEGAKGGSKKKLIIAVVVTLLVFGGVAKFTVLAPSAKAKGKQAAVKLVPGPIMPMDAQTLNLSDGHFLQIKISLETIKGSAVIADTAEASQLVIDEYSNRSMADLTGAAARTKAKNDLVAKLKVAYPKQIMDVFYTGFAMQ